jgi:3-oxoacyl-[acyl-carrier-protein] synthase III
MRDPLDTQAAAAEAKSEEERAKLKRHQQVEDIKWLMAHAAGRRVVSRLLEETGVHRTSFHTNGSTMAMNEGRKQLGYFLTGELLEIVPEGYLRLIKEYRND